MSNDSCLMPRMRTLLALHREARVDEQNGVFLGVALRADLEQAEAALHRADGRDASLGGDVDVEERLDEARSLALERGDARDAGVDRSVSLGEGLLFGFDADSLRRKAGTPISRCRNSVPEFFSRAPPTAPT